MASKKIIMRELDNSGEYRALYPKTSATQVPLTAATSAIFGGTNLTADDAFYKIIQNIQTGNQILIKVVDNNGNPVQGATITGLSETSTTNAGGIVLGEWASDPITVTSPYVDLNSVTMNVEQYVGKLGYVTITLPSVNNNTIIRYTSSTSVKFSNNVNSIDICCVGGGGGGADINYVNAYSEAAAGGGGGGIVNLMNASIQSGTQYDITVGSGGERGISTSTQNRKFGLTGGTSSFGTLVSAYGGGGGAQDTTTSSYGDGGAAGSVGSGTGGNYADVRWGKDSYASPPPPPYGNNGTANTRLSLFNEGTEYFSGGGGSGAAYGGAPNGSNGGNLNPYKPSYGGGGGGGLYFYNDYSGGVQSRHYDGSNGGDGLVIIRIHLES